MITVIVLSKDRAMQAQLTLDSIRKNGGGYFSKVFVLFRHSNDDYRDGYKKLLGRINYGTWVHQDDFRADILRILEQVPTEYVMFATDDDIMYRKIEYSPTRLFNLYRDDLTCFSLRLGRSSTVQDFHTGQPAIMPEFAEVSDDTLVWLWRESPPFGNFGYPLSVDCHIFKTERLRSICKQTQFSCPNSMEGAWQNTVNDTKLGQVMACFRNSVVVNTPLNRVQDVCPNNAGKIYNYSAEALNQLYLQNYVIDLDAFDFSEVAGCHWELPISLKPVEH